MSGGVSEPVVSSDLRSSRALSAFEVLVGAAIVIGHNVYHVAPNEVPILVVLAIVSMRLGSHRWEWSSLGFRKPNSWTRMILVAVAAAALRLILGEYVIDPLTARFWPPAKAPASPG